MVQINGFWAHNCIFVLHWIKQKSIRLSKFFYKNTLNIIKQFKSFMWDPKIGPTQPLNRRSGGAKVLKR